MEQQEYKKFQDETLSAQERAEDLVSRMTVEECAGQLLFGAAPVERLGIPSYNWWNEALHGVARAGMATVFPQAIGLAATFDEDQIFRVADAISTEGRAKYQSFQKFGDHGSYKGLTFWSPNINIFRDPRWGRGQETYGEDPYLTGKIGAAFVRGIQGDNPRCMKAAACAKHFAVHSGPEKIRHEFDAQASKQDMAETYLPAFKELVDAGVEAVMGAYNRTNGEPCCGSKTLLQDILRDEWGFDGHVVSDCWAISDFHQFHHITAVPTESVQLALKNGCDLNCGSTYGHLLAALQEGLIEEADIRRSAVRVMKTRIKLGMFDKETPYDHIPYSKVDCEEHRALNYETACKSLVLLKNQGILPLSPEKVRNIAVIGPNAASVSALLGNYHGTGNRTWTVLEGVQQIGEEYGFRVNYSKGCHLYEEKLEDPGFAGDCLAEARAQAECADAVILVVGMDETIEGEEITGKEGFTGDRSTLLLPESQRQLIEAVCQESTPVILVNMTGSAVDFGYGNDHCAAILQAWYPGAEGGKAVADLIFGEYSPSGKLPVTFYREETQLPDFTNYSMDNRTYKFFKEEPLYPFGFGLSYTSFSYTEFTLSRQVIHEGQDLKATLTVANSGESDGWAVVELYLRDEEASVRVPRHKLCGVQRVFLKRGESAQVRFTVSSSQFCVVDERGNYVAEPGKFTLFAGGCQPDEFSQRLSSETCVSALLTLE